MPILEMKVPSPGESISEVEISAWLVSDGDYVEKDQAIAEVDSDKATLELPAEMAGIISLKVEEGDVVPVGDVCCLIDTDAERPAGSTASVVATPVPVVTPAPIPEPVARSKAQTSTGSFAEGHTSPAARKMMADKGISTGSLSGSGRDGRVLKQDVLSALAAGFDPNSALAKAGWTGSRETRTERMSMLRRKVAERLVGVKNDTAMLTTFNEVDMKPIMDLRKKYKNKFKEEKGVGLGFMGFFTKAVTIALAKFPGVNAMIDGKDAIFHEYADICIAVSSPKGLMVPVIRNAEVMSLAEIEGEIKRLAIRARDGQLTVDEMQGGTFTITNGGVFGSMLSTPIINPPQSAILGMHNIVERPVAVDGKVEIRPIMYVALSYDHRIVDGKESVSFLYLVKELLEKPELMLFSGKEPNEVLLGL
ncbi:MAG: 2-oxoglutarate dehydrogenase complex dihydrolipoyllysine-residue succinyltransferase [Flavobacteriales bacterium]|nr:2-oxoglutarate dehydrogenase complex dihydrolipoyllysine-residue succinyltransferase [Flavobacteriales bacterium]